ncbi:MAG: HisA/HisF-related TIM barrel protein [Promethearchaeota archaeon]
MTRQEEMGFKIIPVIDILNSTCVHAKKGERAKYKPLKNVYFNTVNPHELIKKLHENFGFSHFYIADLDSILNNNLNKALLSQITALSGIQVMLDPGIRREEDLYPVSEINPHELILGLETMEDMSVIEKSIDLLGRNNVLVSIDMYDGTILSPIKDFQHSSIIEVITIIKNQGIKKIILLDLRRVGQKKGSLSPVHEKIREEFKGIIYIGGGIRNLKEILQIRNKGFSGVLIATSLYDGSISIKDVKKNNLL